MSTAIDRLGSGHPPIREQISRLPDSKIRTISLKGAGRPDLIPLWFGESDEPTPDFIKRAAAAALAADHTFYAPNSGVPELRAEIVAYMNRTYGLSVALDRITVTTSGMHGIMLVMQALIDPGDTVAVVGPVWPNCRETVRILGGAPTDVTLRERDGRWHLDSQELFDACGPRTRAIFINSPGNPTGWMMSAAQQAEILDFCRRRGIWIVTDDVYARLVYDRDPAPSFIALAEPDDAVIAVNSFSKSWSMTGWRLGWLTAPADLVTDFAKLNEYNLAGPTTFVQHAGAVALRDGDAYIGDLVERLRRRRDLVSQRLSAFPRVRFAPPEAAFYAFFAVAGEPDSVAFAERILAETGVGLAPGAAFGPAGEGYLRLCFASSERSLSAAMDRLEPYLS